MIADLTSVLASTRKLDLSHALSPQTPPWPGNTVFSATQKAQYEAGYFCAFDLTFAEHTGTHIDAPRHFVPSGQSLESLDLATLIGPMALLDVESEVSGRDYVVPLDALRRWEKDYGRIPRGAFVFVKTGWYRLYDDCASYQSLDDTGVPHYPSLSANLAEALADREVRAVGIDTLSPDPGDAPFPRVHEIFLGSDVLIIENLANLADVPTTGATAIALPMKVVGGTGSPARIVALLEEPR